MGVTRQTESGGKRHQRAALIRIWQRSMFKLTIFPKSTLVTYACWTRIGQDHIAVEGMIES